MSLLNRFFSSGGKAEIDSKSNALLVEEVNATTIPTIASGSSGHVIFPITKEGYTPIAVTSFYGSGNSGLVVIEYSISSTEFDLVVRNETNISQTASWYKAKILYKKN